MPTLDPALTFTRPIAAAYRNGDGALTVAPVDLARFDHDSAGRPLGLLIEPGPGAGLADRAALAAAVLGPKTPATVLHAVTTAAGATLQLAHYGLDATALVNACLRAGGWHRAIGVVAGYLPIGRDGLVRYRATRWQPAAVLGAAPALLRDGAGRPLLAG